MQFVSLYQSGRLTTCCKTIATSDDIYSNHGVCRYCNQIHRIRVGYSIISYRTVRIINFSWSFPFIHITKNIEVHNERSTDL